MKAKKFIQTIEKNSDLPVLFQYGDQKVVAHGYHVTEIKNASYETIDCGNSLHTWNEVIVQIWVPDETTEADGRMSATKFSKIWNAVDSRLKLHENAQIRIEYGDHTTLTSNYEVGQIDVTDEGVVVNMTPPITQCKPRSLLAPLNGITNLAPACCPPSNGTQREETVIPLTHVSAVSEPVNKVATGCCSPSNASGTVSEPNGAKCC